MDINNLIKLKSLVGFDCYCIYDLIEIWDAVEDFAKTNSDVLFCGMSADDFIWEIVERIDLIDPIQDGLE